MPLITVGILKPVYYRHLMKLVCAMRILCSPSECLLNNGLAEQLLKDFVSHMGRLYGVDSMTFNVHSLLHLSKDVMNLKNNSESFSAFKFENVMQHLKKAPRSGHRVLEQIHNRIVERNFNLKPEKFTKKKNKVLGAGLFDQVVVNDMALSIESPNNCIKVNDEIGRIEAIYKNDDGEVYVKVKMIVNLHDSFDSPIPSSHVNMFECDKEKYSASVFINVSKNILVKVAAIELRDNIHYIALLH